MKLFIVKVVIIWGYLQNLLAENEDRLKLYIKINKKHSIYLNEVSDSYEFTA